MTSVKRQLFPTTPRKAKRSKPSLTSEVAQLKRAVNSNKPEVKQKSYKIPLVPGTNTPISVIRPSEVDGEEIRLHRVSVNTLGALDNTGETSQAISAWSILYSPKQGYTETDLPNAVAAHDVDNYLQHLDATKQRVWVRVRSSLQNNSDDDRQALLEADKRFSIPMKCGTSGMTDTVLHNQVYWIGSEVPESGETPTRFLYITIWYTDN